MYIEIVSSLFRVLIPIKQIRPTFSSIRKGLGPCCFGPFADRRTQVLVLLKHRAAFRPRRKSPSMGSSQEMAAVAGSLLIVRTVQVVAKAREPVQGLTGSSLAVRTHCVGFLLNIAGSFQAAYSGM
jgi:hypothetical protein